MTTVSIRDASPDDFAALTAIAAEGDSSADDLYLEFVRANGSLRVAIAERDAAFVAAFGGVIRIDGVAMLTDLFVAEAARGRGIGGTLLADLFRGEDARMTFSSKHPAAVPAYIRAGMRPSWRLLYLSGEAPGTGSSADALAEEPDVSWPGSRPELVRYLQQRGAVVRGGAVLLPTRDADRPGTTIARLHDARGAAAFAEILASLPAGTAVACCSPEHSPVARYALERGFRIVDNDIFCASDGVTLPADLHCLDPGLV